MKVIAVLAVLLATAACGSEGRVRVLAPGELPADLFASPTPAPTAAPARDVTVWFVRDDRLAHTTRKASGAEGLAEFALRAVIEGPTTAEAGAGFDSAIPNGAEFLEVVIDGQTAVVNLSKEFESGAEQNVQLLRLGQVVFTMTSLPDVSRVRFLIDSEPASVIGQDGAAHEEVDRTNYAGLVEPEPTATPA